MSELTAEELATWTARHRREVVDDEATVYAMCEWCETPWPCEKSRLLAHIEALQQQLVQAEIDCAEQHGATCGDCGHTLTLVRPGKHQCDWCELNAVYGELEVKHQQLQGQVSKQREKIEDLENANAWYESQLNEIDGALEEAGRPAGEDAGSEAERIREMANAEIGHATLAANAKIAMDGLQQKVEALQAKYDRAAVLTAREELDRFDYSVYQYQEGDDQAVYRYLGAKPYHDCRTVDEYQRFYAVEAEYKAFGAHGLLVARQAAEGKGE